jgi:hypothetical protein
MAYDAWPPLSVRDWQFVLRLRDPDWGTEEEDFDGIMAASESRRIHELRGVIVGQVAEIENLLLHISDQARERSNSDEPDSRRVRGTAGVLLAHVADLLKKLGLEGEFREHLEAVRETIANRNAIVHAVVDVGFAYSSFNDSRECVLIGIRDNDRNKWKERWESAADWETRDSDAMIPWDISEIDPERQLARAYEALDKCIDIWVRMDKLLPDPSGFA